jgi:hypothetical protein
MNFAVTNSAASLPAGQIFKAILQGNDSDWHTKRHDFRQIGRPKLDHNGVGITIDDLCIM